MTDRLFADCCYGTEAQHLPSELCPQDRDAEVERVARAIALVSVDDPNAIDPFFDRPYWEDKVHEARAAITAIAKSRGGV